MGALLILIVLATGPVRAQEAAPVHQGFVDAAGVVEDLVVDMRYFGAHNFVGRRIDGYEAPRCLLAKPAAVALAQVQRDLAPRKLGLKVFDCYRPARAVAHFMRWARDTADVTQKAEFYPDIDKHDLFRLGYIAERSGHSRGATVDLTLIRRGEGEGGGTDIDMGSPFDLFSPKSWPSDASVGAEARANRALLASAMRRCGFLPYDKEWWHFTLAKEPYPRTYFDFVVK
jgi:D-alanyl-D-alanine dipeptidase